MVEEHKDLQLLHTFGVPWQSRFFCDVTSTQQVIDMVTYCREQNVAVMVLGGGSNILPVRDWDGLVVRNEIVGREVVSENDKEIVLRIGAGESWHDLVVWATGSGYYGLENLVLIPGTVGGAVVQNIGAYDVDLGRFIQSVEAVNLETGTKKTFLGNECEFDYRNSIFKKTRGVWMVTYVEIVLSKKYRPVLTYQPLQERFSEQSTPQAVEVMNAVMEVRQSKLPDWNQIGTAGSFFSNPRISNEEVERLREIFPDMPVFDNYGTGDNTVPAGWLIEHADISQDLKDRFLYPKHHLIVVNNDKNQPNTLGIEIHEFTQLVQKQVLAKFGIELVPEVVVL